MAVGIIGTRLYPAEATLRLERSTPQTFEGYQFVLDEVLAAEGDGYSGRRAAVSLYAGDRYLTTLYPELRAYPGANGAAAQTLARPALRVGWREDVYLALTAAAGDGRSVTVHAALNRLVNWLWLGGLLLLAGGVLALWPTGAAGSEGRVRRALRAILAVGLAVLFVAAGLALWGAGHGSARAATRPARGRRGGARFSAHLVRRRDGGSVPGYAAGWWWSISGPVGAPAARPRCRHWSASGRITAGVA